MAKRSYITPLIAVALLVGAASRGAVAAEPIDVRAEAAAIDKIVAAGLKRHNIEPNPPADDATFLRRAYLDLAGRIPTLEETGAFLDSRDADKRAKLVRKLLDSDAYTSNFFNYWADILRVKSRLTNNVRGDAYIGFVKESLRDNLPYDKFVYRLLTASGRPGDDGATGYFLRDSGMPLDNTANTVRIFLGTQIGCAQCHDHPFDKWTQYEFYETAAYTFGVQTRKQVLNFAELRREAQKAELTPRQDLALRRIVQVSNNGVSENRYRQLRLPDDYKYDDAKPKTLVSPASIFGPDAAVAKGKSPRETFAGWLTARDNPRFALTIANRLWAKLLGAGVIDPVDDIRDDSEPSNPELIEHLAKLMLRVDFDMKRYMEIVANTQTYQRTASRYGAAPGTAYHFPGPLLKRMSAEQVWDTMMTLIVPAIDERPGRDQNRPGEMMLMAMAGMDDDEPIDVAKLSAKELVALVKKLPENPRQVDAETRDAMRRRAFARLSDPAHARWRGYRGDFVRASELPQPANPGHLLHEFGQSDREIIQNASDDPSVTQVLTLLNGPIDRELLGNPSAVLMKNLAAAGEKPADKVRVAFRTIFNRDPLPSELASAVVIADEFAQAGYGDLVWAMLNTREFLFVQ